MKLVFRQYLASLRERKELDAVLPDLLSELGYTVISRPSIGTRQFGVDVAAVGSDSDSKRKVFLFSIKQGDLTRADWDGTPQALRSSINEILDIYIPTRIPNAYKDLDVVICLCFGGEILEAVRDNVTQFTNAQKTDRISFAEWNGDYIAGLLVDGVLREQLVDKDKRASFQKAVAMVDQPDITYRHFRELVTALSADSGTTSRQRATIVRQIYICLWVVYVWARDSGNVEGAFRSSELAMLHAWNVVRGDIAAGGKAGEEIGIVFNELVNLNHIIWDNLLGTKILPFVDKEHAISVAVGSPAMVDISLKLFDVMGRVALRGLWRLWAKSGSDATPMARSDWDDPEIDEIAGKLVSLIRNNPILLNPMTDAQSIDIGIALMFLTMVEPWQPGAANYAAELLDRTRFGYQTHKVYPTIHDNYRSLVQHPRESTDEYREAQTRGSTLFPLISLWAASLGKVEESQRFANFATKYLGHCNTQFWLATEETDGKLWIGDTQNGASIGRIPITADGRDALNMLDAEMEVDTAYASLSAIVIGHWPVLVLACRHYRLPLPPNLWLPLLHQVRAKYVNMPSEPEAAHGQSPVVMSD